MLTQQLRELERDGIIHREVFSQVPPRVDYSLSDCGKTLEPVLGALGDSGAVHRKRKPAPKQDSNGEEELRIED